MMSSQQPGEHSSLADSLEILYSRLVPAFTTDDDFERLTLLASGLPPIHRAGFEYRLKQTGNGLDFQQAIELKPSEIELVLRNRSAQQGCLEPLTDFCTKWGQQDSLLHSALRQLWVEFDNNGEDPGSAPPSLFLGLRKKQTSPESALHITCKAHELLARDRPGDQHQATLKRVIDLIPAETGVTHVGFMLSRTHQVTRLVIPFSTASSLISYLGEINWPGGISLLSSDLDWLFNRFSEVRLCLDSGDSLSPRLGFECFFNRITGADPDYSGILGDLVTAGYCQENERDTLLGWPGRISPDSQSIHWPEDLVLRSITGKEQEFTVIDCRLSHLKFDWSPHSPMKAKAYFGYYENWLDFSAGAKV
jgi:hypothetical protein